MRKVFKAIADAPGICEKQWVDDDAKTPRGWSNTTADALAAKPRPAEPPAEEPGPPLPITDDPVLELTEEVNAE